MTQKFFLVFSILFKLFSAIQALRVVCEYSSWTHGLQKNVKNFFLPEFIKPELCTHLNYNYLNISSNFKIMFATQLEMGIMNFFFRIIMNE